MVKKRIDDAVKKKVCKAHASGIPMRKIASEYGISLSSVSRVVSEGSSKKGKTGGKKAPESDRQKRIEELERKIAELEKRVLEFEAKRKKLKN